MSAKIAKTIARQKEKIAEGNFYEAHQQLRVITSRYLKSSDYTSACDVLYNGALLLLRAGQGGSGGDLAMMLLNEVYNKGEFVCNDANKKRLFEILHAFPPDEPTRKRFITETVGWSGRFGELERGDPEVQDQVGRVFANEGEVYDAERHLILGTSSSAPVLASLHYNWYTLDQPHLAGIYASRSVLPYLLMGNLASANAALSTFTSHLTTSNPHLLAMSQPIESSKSGLSLRIFPSIPLLNFLSLLLLAAQKGDAGLYRQLCKYYAPHLKDADTLWSDALSNIGEVWFGIRMPRQGGNPLFDMMGSMLFGGGGGGGGGGQGGARSNTPKPVTGGGKKEIEKPPTVDLD
ncbi:hypothetical protein LTR99_001296 [Exophiala xenobiotica]|uniref:DUF410-domain-containing protein n=1 Tax=Vermiconidia calcicola TaxID=1690605 RepID=A0AAV9QMJ8_9PEZI|nr:hypothetical protein LTR92_001729 [Exophiala xenobiotica]KAK5545858.1 hypothetical protein LTR25_000868 [Vermiconidia calcicola]KAK5549882.1 hypothetical protein LTR23_000173 [Chaetothyriales sp. CCFEE 6169]KAK5308321.1 hypothetical protein LTR99_001296 [Exophiala xenobiotica]KAK5437822.1 hypothetical protein LTR34_001369 [Exophiala xenobiotica]